MKSSSLLFLLLVLGLMAGCKPSYVQGLTLGHTGAQLAVPADRLFTVSGGEALKSF